ncbi:hypothetical protein [Prevotella falsenii]|uniref:hypothetical protein n=1 Tax=Prevotella falsenii TaxID=515414 RepID=UPI000A629976|nr:hypothetical protein [Prevotella falsenii]
MFSKFTTEKQAVTNTLAKQYMAEESCFERIGKYIVLSKHLISIFFCYLCTHEQGDIYIMRIPFSIFTLPTTAKDWNADNIPMVHLQDARRYVCDPENIMSAAMRDSTDAISAGWKRKPACKRCSLSCRT